MYTGDASPYTYTFALSRTPECRVCGTGRDSITIPRSAVVQDLLDLLVEAPRLLTRASIRCAGETVYMRAPPVLELKTRPNLVRRVEEFTGPGGGEFSITDAGIPLGVLLRVDFKD